MTHTIDNILALADEHAEQWDNGRDNSHFAREALRAALTEALASTSRKQEHVAYSYALASAWAAEEVKLYTAPVVADVVLPPKETTCKQKP